MRNVLKGHVIFHVLQVLHQAFQNKDIPVGSEPFLYVDLHYELPNSFVQLLGVHFACQQTEIKIAKVLQLIDQRITDDLVRGESLLQFDCLLNS